MVHNTLPRNSGTSSQPTTFNILQVALTTPKGMEKQNERSKLKTLLKCNSDPVVTLLSYRSTPLSWWRLSPAQLLMGRQIRSTLPAPEQSLAPMWPNLEEFRKIDVSFKQKQKKNYEQRHRATDLPPYDKDQPVFITTREGINSVPGRVMQETRNRSYQVQTPSGIMTNRVNLHARPEAFPTTADRPETTCANSELVRSPVVTRSRTGTNIHSPDHSCRKVDVL